LAPDEVDELFSVLRRLRDGGAIVILIAHKLSEVFAVADHVTVLRRGEFIGTSPRKEISSEKLARWMVGEFPAAQEILPGELGPPVAIADKISIQGDRGQLAIRDISFQIKAGEIVGFGGVEGNGQDELSEALAGLRPANGSLTLPVDRHRIGYIPQDRQADGLALGLSIEENLLIKGVERPDLVRRGWLQLGAIHRWAAALVEKFAVKTESARSLVGSLSGGNQQKVVVARELDANPELLVVVNPTRGLDIRSTQFVHDSIRQAAKSGTAVALFSTDLDELQTLASSIFFLSRGELVTGNSAETYLGAGA
jgi:simple sugar transport system ATP-binding protein